MVVIFKGNSPFHMLLIRLFVLKSFITFWTFKALSFNNITASCYFFKTFASSFSLMLKHIRFPGKTHATSWKNRWSLKNASFGISKYEGCQNPLVVLENQCEMVPPKFYIIRAYVHTFKFLKFQVLKVSFSFFGLQ